MTITADDFWATIAAAWAQVRGGARALSGLTHKKSYVRRVAVAATNVLLPDMLKALERSLRAYAPEELRAWDAHLQAALAALERPDVRAALRSPSDEAFLYARAWAVCAGRAYYACVEREPGAYGVHDQWEEGVLYVAERVYEKRHGKWA
ncbi:hypothetical protein CC85DRAFT_284215 [Cutaneotrichosporon oleaginosum]|uniref:DUF4240 domain-containing protein n=1 Tax=Cutaneotrichosporon oleaginosum TaxID=879819 RepID=A0A0J0XRJ0_9TREE|nr:uncharacterized protein CC85DRAFT_284215 [Cutaneotrichosporon oleaginosum]KLT43708.1 hypothetical protein CC85DRAFT_284215 [Cutaneotrichosporon oleaginosum]TXT05126.1 hypothetical protein COLE_06446 [Cutaneotrichosporon oleaginosum]